MKDILLSSSLLILVILLIRVIFRRTISRRAQYALWALVLLRLLMPFSVGSSPWNVASVMQEARETQTWETASALYQSHVPRMSYTRAYEQVTEEARNAGEDLAAFSDSELDDRAYVRMMSSLTVQDALRLMWYVGMGFMALLFLAENLRFALKLRRTRVSLEGAESRYPVYLCDDIPSPCLFGLCKPKIYVTSAAAKDPETLRYVIAHEETHARHLDPLWSLLRSLCLVIWWFDPLVWLAAHFSRIDCELACDEGVLRRLGEEKRIPYGETLLKLIPVGRAGNPVLTATTMTAGKRQMKDRILRIAEGKKSLVAALAAALVLAAVVCACTFTGAKEEPEPEPTETVHHTGQPATPAELMPAGEYESPGDYLASRGKEIKEVTCYAAGDLEEMTVPVLDTRVRYLNKVAEIPDPAREGTLEWYDYLIEVKPDAEPGSITLLDGMTATEDGWYDLEGQGGHSLVLLRYPDGSYDALHDQANNDDYGGMYYYEETAEEMLYDWYVRTYRPDLPPWTLDLLPEGTGGNHPARRWDVDGWYLYIPISGWSEASSGGTARWVSRYGTGSSIAVRAASREELTAERPALAEGQAERYIEGENGKLWLVFTQYDPERITGSPEILDEPLLLEAMLESFTVPGGRTAESSGEEPAGDKITQQFRDAADRLIRTYDTQAGPYGIALEAEGRRDEYVNVPKNVWSSLDTVGSILTSSSYTWSPLTSAEIAGVDRSGPVLALWNERDRITVYTESGVFLWMDLKTGTEHWLRSEPKRDLARDVYDAYMYNTARYAEMYRPDIQITVPGTVTDYAEVARLMTEQYVSILLDRPAWYVGVPEDAALNGVTVFDAYYGEDYPNFCFGMGIWLKLSHDPADPNRAEFEAGSGLGEPVPDGPYAGWYGWGGEVTAALENGVWRFLGMATGGARVWLPYGVGWDFDFEKLTTEQLLDLIFLTWGKTRDWNLMHELAQRPAAEVLAELEKRSEEQRQEVLRSMEDYNGEYGSIEGEGTDWYGFFDPDAYGLREEAPDFALLKELSGYTQADWDRLSRDEQLDALYESLRKAAVGEGQVRRDIYVMTAALRSDGAYAELLAAVLRDQYETDPDAWEEALEAFPEGASLLQQMVDLAGEGSIP